MKNTERITKAIINDGTKSIIIHTIPKTPNWIVCQKIEKDKWLITLCDPDKYTYYTVGTVNDEQHLRIWRELLAVEINNKISQIEMAEKLKEQVR